jgi:hypothetical protein
MKKWIGIFFIFAFFSGCTSVTKITDFKGLKTPDGEPIAYIHVSRVAVHLFDKVPIIGNGSIEKAFSRLALEANQVNAKEIRIVQSNRTSWWFSFPPFTLIFTPVTTNVAAEALK